VPLADEKGAFVWKARQMINRGTLWALTGKTSDAIPMITSGATAYRSTGASLGMPLWLSYLARAYVDLGQGDNASRCICEGLAAVKATKETCYEAELNRAAGEIALKSPQPEAANAEAILLERLRLRVSSNKSWELRAAMSMARLWRDQGKREAARELLAPVYGWFTEGFDTLDLKEAKALLDELAS
jgi:predicted ATPase